MPTARRCLRVDAGLVDGNSNRTAGHPYARCVVAGEPEVRIEAGQIWKGAGEAETDNGVRGGAVPSDDFFRRHQYCCGDVVKISTVVGDLDGDLIGLALGHSVFYRGPKFEKNQPPRGPVYAVWKDGTWGSRQRLAWADPRGSQIYTNNCGQRVNLPNGDVIMSFTFGAKDQSRCVCGVRCSFDGTCLAVRETGNALSNPKGRGLLEPSVTRFGGRFFLTIRAEDERALARI